MNPFSSNPLQEEFLSLWEKERCYEGTLIYGGTGSGKTSGSGRDLSLRLLRQNFGGLVLCAKNDEAQRWIDLCTEAGRSEDVILFDHNNPDAKFNFIDYAQATDQSIGSVDNSILALNTFIKNMNGDGSGGVNESFWQGQQDKMIENIIRILYYADKPITVPYIYTLIRNLDKIRRVDSMDEDGETITTAEENIIYKLIKKIARTNPTKSRKLLEYIEEIKDLSANTYSCVVASVTGALNPLDGDLLEARMTRETTVSPDDILFKRKIVIVGFDVKRFQQAGRSVNLIWKEALQAKSEATAGRPNRNPAFLWMDEGQNFITKNDQLFMTTARSAKVATVFLTQNLPNIRSEFGNQNRADAYRGIFQTVIFHQNPCPETNAYMEQQILPPVELRDRCLRRRSYDLETGGAPRFAVEAIAFYKGKKLHPNEERYLKLRFTQQRKIQEGEETPPKPTVWLVIPHSSVDKSLPRFANGMSQRPPNEPMNLHEVRFQARYLGGLPGSPINKKSGSKALAKINPEPGDVVCLLCEDYDKAAFASKQLRAQIYHLKANHVTVVTGMGIPTQICEGEEAADYAELNPISAGVRVSNLIEPEWVIAAEEQENYDTTKQTTTQPVRDGLFDNNEPPPPTESQRKKRLLEGCYEWQKIFEQYEDRVLYLLPNNAAKNLSDSELNMIQQYVTDPDKFKAWLNGTISTKEAHLGLKLNFQKTGHLDAIKTLPERVNALELRPSDNLHDQAMALMTIPFYRPDPVNMLETICKVLYCQAILEKDPNYVWMEGTRTGLQAWKDELNQPISGEALTLIGMRESAEKARPISSEIQNILTFQQPILHLLNHYQMVENRWDEELNGIPIHPDPALEKIEWGNAAVKVLDSKLECLGIRLHLVHFRDWVKTKTQPTLRGIVSLGGKYIFKRDESRKPEIGESIRKVNAFFTHLRNRNWDNLPSREKVLKCTTPKELLEFLWAVDLCDLTPVKAYDEICYLLEHRGDIIQNLDIQAWETLQQNRMCGLLETTAATATMLRAESRDIAPAVDDLELAAIDPDLHPDLNHDEDEKDLEIEASEDGFDDIDLWSLELPDDDEEDLELPESNEIPEANDRSDLPDNSNKSK
jgi:hypothetical protein